MPFSISNLRSNYVVDRSTSRSRIKGPTKNDNITMTERIYSDDRVVQVSPRSIALRDKLTSVDKSAKKKLLPISPTFSTTVH